MIALHSHTTRRWIPIVGLLGAGLMGAMIGWFGVVGMLAVGTLLIGVAIFIKPELAFMASLISITIGQFIRLPILGSDNSVIINDLLLPVLIVAWLLQRLMSRTWSLPRHSLTLPFCGLAAVLGLSLVINAGQYLQREFLSGALYFIRWLEYAALLLLGFDFFRTQARAAHYLKVMTIIGVALSVLGFLQLRIYPDFSFMVPQGWDPHVGRLLSTWFDPNFLAGFLALLVTISLAIALSQPVVRAKWWWLAIMIMTVAIVFTFSRSGYVALVVGVGIVTLVRSRALFFIGLIAAIAIILLVPRVNERVVGIRTIDETAKLRIVSWNNAWEVITDHWWTGVGYNLYRYVQVEYGFLDSTQEHSASGSDSSILTIWVTTGFLGLILYLWLYAAMMWESIKTWRDKNLSPVWRGFGLGLLAGLIGLFFHSQFVNSLLYPHIMQAVWLFVAMAVMVRQPQR